MGADETQRGPVEPEDDTAIVAEETARREAAAVAWSLDTVPDEAAPVADDRRPLPRALTVLLAAVGAGAIALAAFVLGQAAHHPSSPPAAAPQSHRPAPPPAPKRENIPEIIPEITAPAPAPTAAPPTPARSDTDSRYLAYLREEHVPYRSGDADAVASAHEICRALATRDAVDETSSVQHALGWTYYDSATLVSGAIAFYCPGHAPPAQ